MIRYAVLWTVWVCPGGPFARFVPPATRPIVCTPRAEIHETDRHAEARRKVLEVGGDARIRRCRGFRCRDEQIQRRTLVEFEPEERP